MPAVKLEKVSKSFGDFKIEDVSFEVKDKEYFVVLGPSGAGKTLLLQLIAGIHKPDKGRIIIGEEDVTRLPPEKRGIGYVPQNYALFSHLTVYENIAFPLRVRKLPDKLVCEKVEDIASRLGIKHLLNRKTKTLSGGEAQRVALARALAAGARLLLLDEPLSAVDPVLRWELRSFLRRFKGENELTVIHVTHDFSEAIVLANRIAVMNKGRIVQVGTPDEVFYKPSSAFVAWFTRSGNIFRGEATRVEEGLSEIRTGSLKLYVIGEYSGRVTVTFRPESVIVSRKPVSTSARNHFEGVIEEVEVEGPLVLLKVRVEDDEVKAYITRTSFRKLNLAEGCRVHLYVKAADIHVIKS